MKTINMNNPNDTPRTDALDLSHWMRLQESINRVIAEELNAQRKQIKELQQQKRNCIEIIDDDTIENSELKAEVERLRSQRNRAVEIAEEFWDNQKQAVTVYHEELADELAALKGEIE